VSGTKRLVVFGCVMALTASAWAQASKLKVDLPKGVVRVATKPAEFQVAVQNTGPAAANAVVLSVQSECCEVSIEPKSVASLPSGGRATFSVRLTPKPNMTLTSYGLYLDLASDGQPAERAGEMAMELVTEETGLGPEYAEVGTVTVRVSRVGEGPRLLLWLGAIVLVIAILVWRKARQSAKTPPVPPVPPKG
jgi:hypothetical protein